MSISYFPFFPFFLFSFFPFFSLDIRSVKASRVFHLIFGLLKPHEHSLPCPSLPSLQQVGRGKPSVSLAPLAVRTDFLTQLADSLARFDSLRVVCSRSASRRSRYPMRLFHCFKLSITTFACCTVSHRIESTFVARLMKSANACSDESRSAPIVFKSAHKQRISRACGSRSSKSAMLVV